MSLIISKSLDQVDPLIDFFFKEKSVGVGFLRFKPVGRGKRFPEFVLSKKQRKELIRKVYKRRVEIGEDFYLKVETPVSILIAIEFHKKKKKNKYATKLERGCPGGITMCHIKSNGKITSCSQMPVIAGDLRKQSITDIWKNSKLFQKLRSREYKGYCGNCKHKYYCGGCRSSAYIEYGNVLAQDPGCWYPDEE